MSRYQKGKTNLDFTEARDSEWQWHQLGHMQVCTSLQTDDHATPHNSVFTGRMPLPPNQQRQSTEGITVLWPLLISRPASKLKASVRCSPVRRAYRPTPRDSPGVAPTRPAYVSAVLCGGDTLVVDNFLL